ncbi:hypothetical protein IV203_026646 [Nitzschia inconspicua]|uniref:Uncharacterized protein n=1 Tax=Nitzschia inconspicua TaxID=303405 RepID=A0A9K3LMN7_9STRA|nr:hypothetical protein IV203_026646 [Nitzschia inconspicua]
MNHFNNSDNVFDDDFIHHIDDTFNDELHPPHANDNNAIEVHDFDVLADELPGSVYDMDDYKKQIGNNRFEVLITMYQEDFNKNYSKNNMAECDTIVKKIVDVTCHKASSSIHQKGRFLVKPIYSDDTWRQLDDEESKQFVMQALRTPAVEEEEELVQENLEGNEEDDVFAPLPVTSKIDFSTSDIPSMDFKNMGLIDTKKRGRRQSLLRRSASEDITLLDKKKGLKNLAGELYRQGPDSSNSSTVSLPSQTTTATFRRYHSAGPAYKTSIPAQGSLHRHNTVSELPPTRSFSDGATSDNIRDNVRKTTITTGGTMAHTIQGMDVVLASDCKSFSNKSHIIGNNRLKVMLVLEERRFHTLSESEQNNAACNLVKAVTDFWKGRILADNGFAYRILNHQESVEALKTLLSSTPDHSFSGGGVSSTLKPGTTSLLAPSAPAKLLAAAPPVPDYLRNASQEILMSGKGRHDLAGPEQMQSAAVRSIKERAGKRQMAKSTRNTSTGGKGCAASPIPTKDGATTPQTADDKIEDDQSLQMGTQKVDSTKETKKEETSCDDA